MAASSIATRGRHGRNAILESSRYRLAVAGFLVLVVALFGGASRADEPAQQAVRVAAILVLAASLWPLEFAAFRRHRALLLFAAACAALPLSQLIPLPPAWWAGLPGHGPYAEIATATGTVGWRPLSLTPDLTVNAVEALLVPASALVAALYLGPKDRKSLAAVFTAIALLSAMLGLAQIAAGGDELRLFERTSENAPVGLFANRNHQAVLLACALPLGAAAIPRALDERARALIAAMFLAASVTLAAVVVLTGSRMGVILLVLAIAGAAWIANRRGLVPRPRTKATLAAWAAGGLGIALAGAAIVAGSGGLQRFRIEDIAADTRGAALPSLIETAAAFLPTGSGFGSFDSVYRQFEPDALLSTIYLNQAHNEPLQLLIEGGIPAILLLLVFLLWWGRAAAAIVRGGAATRSLPRAAVLVTSLLMASSIVDYPLRTPLLAALFAFCCAEMALAGSGDGAGRDVR